MQGPVCVCLTAEPWEWAAFSLGNTVLVEVLDHHWMALLQINLAFSKVSFSSWSYLPNCIFEKCFLVEHLHDLTFSFIDTPKTARWTDGALFFEPSMNILEKQWNLFIAHWFCNKIIIKIVKILDNLFQLLIFSGRSLGERGRGEMWNRK